ncbi:peptidoglycan-binding protein [Streptomyces sp. NPDC051286]|uniref:peptidoglycan-binding protein n=1 Tax=Streptomyces sp. NPDC051286 TaxID=3365647 RepID=UPI0037905AB8
MTRQTLTDSRSEDAELGYGSTITATGNLSGTLTELPAAGRKITRGQALYEVDEHPVTLMYGSVPAYRVLKTGTEGTDVKQLEKNLKALGYTGFAVDDEYTDSTAAAVEEWQKDRGLEETGTVEPGQVVFTSGPVRVDTLVAAKGDRTGPNQKVLSYTGTTKVVTVELDTTDQRLAEQGRKVTVTLPDDTKVDGRIAQVSTIIEAGSGEQDEAKTKVEVVVALDGAKAQKAADKYALAAVHVDFTAGRRKNVLTVPVAALLALEEGGFGVEVVKGSTTSYVPVTTGLFAGGRVEVSGDGVTEGTKVGMPE